MAGLRKVVRRIAAVLAIVLGLIVVHALVAIFPQPLFRHRVTHGDLEVYCTEEMPPEIHAVLDRVESLLAASEIHEPDLRHEVYLFNSYRLMRLMMVRNVHFGANLLTGDSFITRGDAVRRNDASRIIGVRRKASRRCLLVPGSISSENSTTSCQRYSTPVSGSTATCDGEPSQTRKFLARVLFASAAFSRASG